jgi:hypothetical protein
MRAYEILENLDPPSKPVTLRSLHKLKHEMKAREESKNRRLELVAVMYGNPEKHRERLELEQLELSLRQTRAEIAATEAEAAAKSREAVSDMAKSGMKVAKQSDQKVTAMAKHGMLGRRKKCSTVLIRTLNMAAITANFTAYRRGRPTQKSRHRTDRAPGHKSPWRSPHAPTASTPTLSDAGALAGSLRAAPTGNK